jgi:cyclohexanone monooxygenase
VTTHTTRETGDIDVLDALVVGAGFNGLYQLDRLRERGFAVKVWEEAPELGGVWYWNCYPGARVDSPGRIYQYSRPELLEGWSFDEAYPGREELRNYFAYVDGKLDLTRDVTFNARVTRAEFDEDTRRWTVTSAGGDVVSARFLIMCTGFAAKPYIPQIAGLEDFAGERHHTARWPQDGLDLAGKRVAVIGTGASGVQVIQEAGSVAEHLTVFQRTPNIAIPMRQRRLDDEQQRALQSELPERMARRSKTFGGGDFDFLPRPGSELTFDERQAELTKLWEIGGFSFWLGSFSDLIVDMDINREVYEFWRDRTRERIADPALAEKLAPSVQPHPFGVVRPSLEQSYYEVFNRDNVTLVDVTETPIERITEHGAVTSTGEHRFDVLVLATGFDAVTGGLTAIDIRGTSGETLGEKWVEGVSAHLGIATSGFPNLLFLYGPQSPGAFCNGPSCAELQGDAIVNLLESLRQDGHTRLESTAEADEAWRGLVLGIGEQTLFRLATTGWYVGANIPGKKQELLQFAGGVPMYLEQVQQCSTPDYAGFKVA